MNRLMRYEGMRNKQFTSDEYKIASSFCLCEYAFHWNSCLLMLIFCISHFLTTRR